GVRAVTANSNGALKASGTIEATTVNVSPELAGKVKEVRVSEGQTVQAGQVLLVLDDTLLSQQREVAAAGLASAQAASQSAAQALTITQAQYQQTLESALVADKKTRTTDWFSKDQQQFDQPNWYFSRAEQIQMVQSQVDSAHAALEQAQSHLSEVTKALEKSDFLAAEQRLLDARLAYLISKDVNERAQNSVQQDAPQGRFNRTHCGTNDRYQTNPPQLTNIVHSCTGDQHLTEVSQQEYDAAQAELKAAQAAYNGLLTSQAAGDVLSARAEVSVAQERYYAALDRLTSLQKGDQSPVVQAAAGAVAQAQAALEQSQKGAAEAAANLSLLEAQLGKLTVHSPMAGVILTRNIEPGEYVAPGGAALTMGDLKALTITVYVPEDRYGQIHVGQQASVVVDSFPGTQFSGAVSTISDQAEFTPRNVQTVEGRSSTVYAIKLTVTDPAGKLKPGMPADVTFQR
ncbi:MAG TPA: efflux RND transporter periplasmic adaptor subunit, partial [Anaerolineales bacterium]